MPIALYLHRCEVCYASFKSIKRIRKVCGIECRNIMVGRIRGSKPSKQTCDCGKPANKRGFCKTCSSERKRQSRRNYYYRHREKILKNRHDRWIADDDLRKRHRKYNEKNRFNGLRRDRLQLDNNMCQHCGSAEQLIVHHHRLHGPNRTDRKSIIDDLLTLCRSCHINLHRGQGDLG